MGIVNVTPDSFSDGGLHASTASAIAHAESLLSQGAHILDIGGESSRPGAVNVSVEEELLRVLPVIRALRDWPVPIAVDTVKADVMRAAIDAGASMINDINALRTPGALEIVAASDAAVCLMHMQGEPRTMQLNPAYGDVVGEVGAFLGERAAVAMAAGIARERIVLDPGFGFGKSVDDNFDLLAHLADIARLGFPVLAGLSRKSMLGAVTGKAVGERLSSSIAAAVLALERGAAIIRVHDVAETIDALKVFKALKQHRLPT
jgi:dihydropteroate synthase